MDQDGDDDDTILKEMRQLKVVVNTANKEFLVDFCQGNGILALSNYMASHSKFEFKIRKRPFRRILLPEGGWGGWWGELRVSTPEK